MKKFEIQDKSFIVKWIILGFCFLWIILGGIFFGYRTIIRTEWYHQRQLKKAYRQEYAHINDEDKIIYVGISANGEDGPWEYFYDAPDTLFDDMSCNSFEEIDDPDLVEEILSYDWIMVVFKDASKSVYHISPENKIYWGTSFEVECPSLLQWYKENQK